LRELSELLDQLGRLELAASPHQDPLKPMPVPSWRRGKNLTHLVMWVLAGLAAVLAALQSEAVHALKPFFVRFFGAHPWIAFAAVAVLGALCAWLAWVLHHLRRTK
jgi:ferric-dicitrate binding protein FerR (iron transport regulator)